MKIGYPCINRSIGCSTNRAFRLKSYCDERFLTTVTQNLDCLLRVLFYNQQHNLLFFRISSDVIPFASHTIITYNWPEYFKEKFATIGVFIKNAHMRISMHPDQFVVLNSKDARIVESSISELRYHAQLLDALGLDTTAKIQIHVGGAYGDKSAAMQRFIATYSTLDTSIKRRLVIENDDRLFSMQDCLFIHEHTGIPIIFDVLHHEVLNNGESVHNALQLALNTWQHTDTRQDGIGMVDYSSQASDSRVGKHAETLDTAHFKKFITDTQDLDFDIMLEIKDKEFTALKALDIAQNIRKNLY